MKRSGLITTKIGMTRLYDDGGVAHPVTVLSVGDCAVIGNRTQEKNGYVANILGLREAKAKHVAKPQLVAAEKAGVQQYDVIVEMDGIKIENSIDLRKHLYNEKEVGDTLQLKVYRQGKLQEFTLQLIDNTTL